MRINIFLVLLLFIFSNLISQKKATNPAAESFFNNMEAVAINDNDEQISSLDDIEIAYFAEGKDSLYRYIQSTLYYPTSAIKASIQGTVKISFVIDKNGDLEDVTVRQSLYPEIDTICYNAIKNMPQWVPAKLKDSYEPVPIRITMPMHFRLK